MKVKNKKFSDIKLLFVLLAASIVANYFLPTLFSYLWFIGLLVAFFVSKSHTNYFWIVLFWVIFSTPGYLFYKYGVHHLPVISITGLGRNVYYEELFGIMVVIKAVMSPIKQIVFYREPLLVIIVYSIFLIFIGLFSGIGIFTILKSVRYFIPLLLLLFIPRIIPYQSFPNIFFLMFISSMVMIIAQLFDILFGYPLAVLFGETQLMVSGKEVGADFSSFDVTTGAVRTIYGPFILLFSLIVSIIYLNNRRKEFKPWLLYMISLFTTLSIFLSATRGLIIAACTVLAGLLFYQRRRFRNYAVSGIIIILLALSIPRLNMQIVQSFERVLTLEALMKGDLTAEGSLSRITERSPRVMNKFWEKPVLGFGFTDEYYEYADGHVGNQTLLLNGGIVGYMIYLYFIVYILYKSYRSYTVRKNRVMIMFIFGILALILIHSTSAMVFSYAMNVNGALSLSLFFYFSDYFLKNRGHSGSLIAQIQKTPDPDNEKPLQFL